MAADDPILLNLTGATFLLSAETGGIIQSFSQSDSRKKLEVYDGASGKTTGLVYHDPRATFNVRIISTGTTGVAAASPGVALTLANAATTNGVATGGIYTDTVERGHQAGQLQEFTVTATQIPGIS